MWRTSRLQHIEITKQTTGCANASSISFFDSESFQ
jgi:hypothetical protein